MTATSNYNKKYLIGFRVGVLIILFLLISIYIHYTSAVKFYRPFYITVSDSDSLDVSIFFEIYGVSYFGDTVDLSLKDGRFYNCDNCYFVDIGMKKIYIFNKDTLIINYIDAEENLSEIIISNNLSFFNDYKGGGLIDKICSIGFIKALTFIFVLGCILLIVFIIKSKTILVSIKKKWIEKYQLYFIILLFFLSGFVIILLFYFITEEKPHLALHDFKKSIILEHQLESIHDGYVITIEDTACLGLEFVFSINGNFWFSSDSALSSIRNISIDEMFKEDKELIQAWKFVSNNTYHRMPEQKIESNRILDNPFLLLNSSGYGICSNRANTLCVIWENMGYKTRIWNVKGLHVFPEVFNGNKWLMLDPDYGLLLRTEEGQIVSLDDIRIDSFLVPVLSGRNNFICNPENMIDTFPIRLKNIYKNDSLASYYMLTDKTLEDTYFKLPSGAKLTFPIFVDSLDTYILEVFIPGFYEGEIKIPLLINSLINNKNKRTDSLLKCRVLYDDFNIIGENIVISALINPLLFIPKTNKKISLCYSTNNSCFPEIKISNKSTNYDTDLFQVISYFSELIYINKNDYLEKSKKYLQKLNHATIIDWKDIEKVVKLHFNKKEYPLHKMEILKRALLFRGLTDQEFFEQINYPGNIAIILIILDKCDNDNYFLKLEQYFKM